MATLFGPPKLCLIVDFFLFWFQIFQIVRYLICSILCTLDYHIYCIIIIRWYVFLPIQFFIIKVSVAKVRHGRVVCFFSHVTNFDRSSGKFEAVHLLQGFFRVLSLVVSDETVTFRSASFLKNKDNETRVTWWGLGKIATRTEYLKNTENTIH